MWIVGLNATLTFQGQPDERLAVSSFDPTTGKPDAERSDGRAFISLRGGTMELDATDVSYLGYPSTGATSGIAWNAYDGRQARGHARDATFSHNYYGAYVAGGDGLEIDHAAFTDNVLYGFDPHSAHGPSSGMSLMPYRAAMIGGTLTVTSQPNAGTRIECRFVYPA